MISPGDVVAPPAQRVDASRGKIVTTYGDFTLLFEVVYYVTSPDYLLFMDIQHAINLDIHRRFAEDGIEFAYPTQTVYVMGRGARPDTAEPAAPVSNGPARAVDRA
jgi:small-conductance mechanosensitive channel